MEVLVGFFRYFHSFMQICDWKSNALLCRQYFKIVTMATEAIP